MVLRKLRSTPSDPDDIAAKEEYYQTREQLRLDDEKLAATGHGVWTAVCKKKSYRKRMIVGFMTQWGAEFAGPLVIVSLAHRHAFHLPRQVANEERITMLSSYIRTSA